MYTHIGTVMATCFFFQLCFMVLAHLARRVVAGEPHPYVGVVRQCARYLWRSLRGGAAGGRCACSSSLASGLPLRPAGSSAAQRPERACAGRYLSWCSLQPELSGSCLVSYCNLIDSEVTLGSAQSLTRVDSGGKSWEL